MKPSFKNLVLSGLAAFAVVGSSVQGHAQTTVTVNPSQSWIGYMNVFNLSSTTPYTAGNYLFGQTWTDSDLRANFSGVSTNILTLTPCTNVFNPAHPNYTVYVNTNNDTPNAWMDASFYVQNDVLAGQTVTFTGVCASNSLSSDFQIVAFVKDFASDYSYNTPATIPLTNGQPFSVSLTTTPGDHIQYGFEMQGPDVNPTNLPNVGKVVVNVDRSYPSLLPLSGASLIEGQTATFSVQNVGGAATGFQWIFSNAMSNAVLSDGGNIHGAGTSTLTISNVTVADAGNYTVVVSNSTGQAQETALLAVQPASPVIRTNMLIDPGFESGAFATTSTAGWIVYGGATFQNTNDYYYASATPVAVVDGTNAMEVYSSGYNTYNGTYQERPASPGEVFTAQASFLTPQGLGAVILSNSVCYLEVQFRATNGAVLVDYQSAHIDTNSPVDTWITLAPTNIYAGDFSTFLGTSPYMVAPPGTASVRYQITLHSFAAGSVYVDATDLRLREPVATATASNGNVTLSFSTLFGPTYDVLYKTNLTDSTWQKLTSVMGDGSVKTVTDPTASGRRFYIINTQ